MHYTFSFANPTCWFFGWRNLFHFSKAFFSLPLSLLIKKVFFFLINSGIVSWNVYTGWSGKRSIKLNQINVYDKKQKRKKFHIKRKESEESVIPHHVVYALKTCFQHILTQSLSLSRSLTHSPSCCFSLETWCSSSTVHYLCLRCCRSYDWKLQQLYLPQATLPSSLFLRN